MSPAHGYYYLQFINEETRPKKWGQGFSRVTQSVKGRLGGRFSDSKLPVLSTPTPASCTFPHRVALRALTLLFFI